jgi:hypothetical protein
VILAVIWFAAGPGVRGDSANGTKVTCGFTNFGLHDIEFHRFEVMKIVVLIEDLWVEKVLSTFSDVKLENGRVVSVEVILFGEKEVIIMPPLRYFRTMQIEKVPEAIPGFMPVSDIHGTLVWELCNIDDMAFNVQCIVDCVLLHGRCFPMELVCCFQGEESERNVDFVLS